MTKNGKCDVVIALFTKDNTLLTQISITFDVKPTIKELKERFQVYKRNGATTMRIATTPSCMIKTYKL